MSTLIPALFSWALCACLGRVAARRVRQTRALMTTVREAVAYLDGALRAGGETLDNALRGCGLDAYRALADILRAEPTLPVQTAFDRLQRPELMPREAWLTLRALACALERGTYGERAGALSYALKTASRCEQTQREREARDAKMYTSLGALGGAALFILLV